MGCSFHCVSFNVWQPTSIPPYLTLTFSFHNISPSSEDRRRRKRNPNHPIPKKLFLFSPLETLGRWNNSLNLTLRIFFFVFKWVGVKNHGPKSRQNAGRSFLGLGFGRHLSICGECAQATFQGWVAWFKVAICGLFCMQVDWKMCCVCRCWQW